MSSTQHSQEDESQADSAYPVEVVEEQGTSQTLSPKSEPKEKSKGKRRMSKSDRSGSDTQTEEPKMSSRSSKTSHSSGSKKHSSSSSSKADDWTGVTDPEERRRIQNRIAQRKFRGKAREQKEKNERDSRNQEHAGSSYRIPEAGDMTQEDELSALSGLPWGGVNMRYVVERGPEGSSGGGGYAGAAGSHGSQGSLLASDNVYGETTQYLSPYSSGYQYTASWDGRDGSSGGEEIYYDNNSTPFYYGYDYDGSPTQ